MNQHADDNIEFLSAICMCIKDAWSQPKRDARKKEISAPMFEVVVRGHALAEILYSIANPDPLVQFSDPATTSQLFNNALSDNFKLVMMTLEDRNSGPWPALKTAHTKYAASEWEQAKVFEDHRNKVFSQDVTFEDVSACVEQLGTWKRGDVMRAVSVKMMEAAIYQRLVELSLIHI